MATQAAKDTQADKATTEEVKAEEVTTEDTKDVPAEEASVTVSLSVLQALIDAKVSEAVANATVAAQALPVAGAVQINPKLLQFDKGEKRPKVLLTRGTEVIKAQARHAHILEALGWTREGAAAK